jgi:hypothetical protein
MMTARHKRAVTISVARVGGGQHHLPAHLGLTAGHGDSNSTIYREDVVAKSHLGESVSERSRACRCAWDSFRGGGGTWRRRRRKGAEFFKKPANGPGAGNVRADAMTSPVEWVLGLSLGFLQQLQQLHQLHQLSSQPQLGKEPAFASITGRQKNIGRP